MTDARSRNADYVNTHKDDSLANDFLISIFMAALYSYRHDTVLRPFPSQFCNSAEDEKDVNKLKKCAENIPHIGDIERECVPTETRDLIKWITEPRNSYVRTMSESEIDSLSQRLEDSSEWRSPTWVFEVMPSESSERRFRQAQADRKVFLTYHGSRIENFHSIIHNGLVSHMNKNGLFGEGTYLSTAISVSMHYSPLGAGWSRSSLGETLSCVAICEVINDASVKFHSDDVARSSVASSEGGNVPDKYYLATNDEMVRVRYLLVYAQKSSHVRQRDLRSVSQWFRRNKFIVSMIFYIFFLALIGLCSSKSFMYKLSKILSLN